MSDYQEDDGVAVIGALLALSEPIATFPETVTIAAGELPEGFAPPAILVRTISSVPLQLLAGETTERFTDRVSVTVKAKDYDQQRRLIRLLQRACSNRTGNFAGCRSVSVLPAGLGPDIRGQSGTFDQTQSYRVSAERDA